MHAVHCSAWLVCNQIAADYLNAMALLLNELSVVMHAPSAHCGSWRIHMQAD